MADCSFLSEGTYVLLNTRGGTALDLVGEGVKLGGYILHYRDNQQWKFVDTGLGWAIKSCHQSKDGKAFYLSIAGGYLAEHTRLKPSTVPTSWDVALVDGALRISWPMTNFVVELAWSGDLKPGTEIAITQLKQGERCQLWNFARCGERAAPDQGLTAPPLHVLADLRQDVALELDGASRRFVKHRPMHKDHSQLWKMIATGDEEVIQACRDSLKNEPLYLSVEGRAERDAAVVASPYPVGWRVERPPLAEAGGQRTVRIFWPGTNLVISPQKGGDGDRVVLADCDDAMLSKWRDVTI